jgi:glycerol uptake facilitator-like aquaporin
MVVYITAYSAISPNEPPPSFSPTVGPFASPGFIGGSAGVVISAIILTVFILGFGPVTGGHLNPFITIATFFVRLTSMPRAVLYLSFQTLGASLAGLMLRASWGSRDFKVGGCFLFENEGTTVGTAFAIEFTVSFALIIIIFGVGFDPRNKEILGPVLGPLLIGCLVGVLNLGFGFPKYGYGGPGLFPTRCFGAYVGSHFTHYHWIHWVGPTGASIANAIIFTALPPWEIQEKVPKLKADHVMGKALPVEAPLSGVMQRTNNEKMMEDRERMRDLGV